MTDFPQTLPWQYISTYVFFLNICMRIHNLHGIAHNSAPSATALDSWREAPNLAKHEQTTHQSLCYCKLWLETNHATLCLQWILEFTLRLNMENPVHKKQLKQILPHRSSLQCLSHWWCKGHGMMLALGRNTMPHACANQVDTDLNQGYTSSQHLELQTQLHPQRPR